MAWMPTECEEHSCADRRLFIALYGRRDFMSEASIWNRVFVEILYTSTEALLCKIHGAAPLEILRQCLLTDQQY